MGLAIGRTPLKLGWTIATMGEYVPLWLPVVTGSRSTSHRGILLWTCLYLSLLLYWWVFELVIPNSAHWKSWRLESWRCFKSWIRVHTRTLHLPRCMVFLWFYHALYLWKKIGMFHFWNIFISPCPWQQKFLYKVQCGSKIKLFTPFIFVLKRCRLLRGFRIWSQNWNRIIFDPILGKKNCRKLAK